MDIEDEDEDRRGQQRRSTDRTLLEWRGRISEQVRAHERRFETNDRSVRELGSDVRKLRDDVITLKGEVAEARSDIAEAVEAISQSRSQEITDLQATITAAKVTGRDLLQWIVAPLAVLIVGTLIVALIVGHGHLG